MALTSFASLAGKINPFTDVDYGAAIRKAFGDQSADVLPKYDNVAKRDLTGDGVASISGTDAYAPGGSKYVSEVSPKSSSENLVTGTLVGGGSVSQGPSLAEQQQAAANPLLSALEALGVSRQTADTRAQSDYSKILKQYQDQMAIDRSRYDEQTTQNEQNLARNRQASLLQASQGGQGLKAVLAAMGALNGTGSILADRAISQAANRDIGGAQDTFETNASSLNRAWADTEAEDAKRRAQAEAAREAALAGNEANFLNSRIDILGKLANIFGTGTSRGNQYADEAAGLYDRAARIPQGQAVSYTPVSNLYSNQNLSNYLAGVNNLQVQAQSGNSQPNAPSVIATPQRRRDELN